MLYDCCMWLLVALLAVVLGVLAFFRMYPPFGGRSARTLWASSKNFQKRIFVNQIPTPMDISIGGMVSIFRDMARKDLLRRPPKPLKPEPLTAQALLAAKQPALVWFGHSASLIRIQNKTLLLDPMLGPAASPFPFAGPKRFSPSPITAEDLPPIDAVLISHDHYDHLDYPTIKKLRSKVTMFFVPLGVAAHLRKWGVRSDQITELDWWSEVKFEGLKLVCTPSRHFSGRTLTDRFMTLWCSWVINAGDTALFFSGDTGYGPHFKEIGKKYGPFDLTLMECGQYDHRWPNIHMLPEQTFAAHQDLRGKRLFPLHWGAFMLALHPWADSVERIRKAAEPTKTEVMTPKIGQVVPIKAASFPSSAWWKDYS